MFRMTRKFLFSTALPVLALTLMASPANAKTTHHKHHTTHHSSRKHHVSGSEIIRIAQRHLLNLGYYDGSVDGLMGPRTREAIRKFQSEHNLKADGVLGPRTRSALENADNPLLHGAGPVVVPAPNPNAEVHQDYTTSLNGDTKIVPSRFARVDVAEVGSGSSKHYTVNLNGQAILTADGQSSVIGISPTYDVGNEDDVIFTTYSPSDTGCIYRNHVLVMNNNGSKILDIGNCTREYHAQVNDGSLWITFSEPDDARAIGATWRVEGETAERM